jgi:hypothetical protein
MVSAEEKARTGAHTHASFSLSHPHGGEIGMSKYRERGLDHTHIHTHIHIHTQKQTPTKHLLQRFTGDGLDLVSTIKKRDINSHTRTLTHMDIDRIMLTQPLPHPLPQHTHTHTHTQVPFLLFCLSL